MRSRGILMLVIAVIAGLAAVILAASWIQTQGGGKGSIAVANADIELGGRITPEMIRMAEWPDGSKPAGAITDPAKLPGRVVLVGMQRGEPITEGRLAPIGTKGGLSAVVPEGKRAMTVRVNDVVGVLAPIGTKGGLSAVVPEGKRAMTVRVNDVVGVAGFALPGTYVDVMVNTQDEGGQRADRDHSISKIVLERILVLAVAQEADRDSTKPKVVNAVTLELTPKDAEMLDLARSVGTLSLVLRNQTDPLSASVGGGATKSALLGLPAPPPVQVAASAPAPAPAARRIPVAAAMPVVSRNCVEVIRGLSKVTECF